VLEKPSFKVFRLELNAGQATLPHRHGHFYVFISIGSNRVSNEVNGRPAKVAELSDGELRTSKGGFTLAERNAGDAPLQLLVVEVVDSTNGSKFATPMADFRFHDGAVGPLFESDVVRGYEVTLASQGRTEKHEEKYDRLLVALSELQLRNDVEGKGVVPIERKLGNVLWLQGNVTESLTNSGARARFIVLEFRQTISVESP
jgi:hypothetical protein